MPDSLSPALVVCLALALVAAINAALVATLARGSPHAQIELLQRAVRSIRDPWKKENEAVDELRRRVAGLKSATAASDAAGQDQSAPSGQAAPGAGPEELDRG